MPVPAPLSPRRQQLLLAAVEVVAAHGMRGLTHRAVDREAQLPQGSCSSYLRTRSALQNALADFVSLRLSADIRALNESLELGTGELDTAIAATNRLFLGWLSTPALLIAKLELSLEASRDDDLAEVFSAWRRDLVQVVNDILVETGRDHSSAQAETLVAVLDGILLGALLRPREEQSDYLHRCLAQLMGPLIGSDREATH